MPKVSVIIPVYGVEKYIERCARSLFEQTLDDIEYLFIDDCSPDNSIKVLESVISEYPNRKKQILIHRMAVNCGQASVRKWGVENASGEYIIHCDSDDWTEPIAYESLYNYAKEKNADIVICDYVLSNGSECIREVGWHKNKRRNFLYNIMCQKDIWSLWNKLIRKDILKNTTIWPMGDMGEDMVICMQAVYYAKTIEYLPLVGYYYRRNLSSITKSMSKERILHRFNQSIMNAESIIDFCSQKGIYEKYKNQIEKILFNKKNLLLPLINIEEYYILWRNTFREINIRVFINPSIPLTSKVKHLLALLGYNRL